MANPAGATNPSDGARGDSSTPTGPGTPGPSPATDSFAERFRGVTAVVVAVLVLLGFALLALFLVGQAATATEGSWSRLVYLFGAAEALVFTAVGWLFGREINRQAIQNADARATDATARAETATNAAADGEARGRALKAAVETRARLTPTPSTVQERGIGSSDATRVSASADVRELAEFARTLFPDR